MIVVSSRTFERLAPEPTGRGHRWDPAAAKPEVWLRDHKTIAATY